MTFNLEDFDLAEMTRFGAALRRLGNDAPSMETAASRAAHYIFGALADGRGQPACVLVRLFKTHAYTSLPDTLKSIARARVDDGADLARLRCLTLLGTAGLVREWCSRELSVDHQAIPLTSEASVARAPMIAALLGQLGVPLHRLVQPPPDMFREAGSTMLNVFHVPVARRSEMVPAQDSFVEPFGVSSVIGFGGGLASGDVFAVILFSRVHVDAETAELFKTLSLNVKLALGRHQERVFT